MAASLGPSCFFEGGLGGRTALGMSGPGLLARQAEALEQAAHAPDAVAHAVDLLGMSAEVHHPPGTHPVPLRIRTTQHPGFEGRLLPRRQLFRPARLRSVVQPLRFFRIVVILPRFGGRP